MFDIEAISSKSVLAVAAAIGYALATLLMKIAAGNPTLLIAAAICAALVATAMAEVLLLRQVDLGLAYIAIIATETLVVLAASYLIGEPLTAKQMAGGALVVLGASLVSF
ncbi:MAG: 5-aminolevulinate synthase [Maritimibacter sp.]|nr:5-aminolevulinate synthase [Maritimibacter sp.]